MIETAITTAARWLDSQTNTLTLIMAGIAAIQFILLLFAGRKQKQPSKPVAPAHFSDDVVAILEALKHRDKWKVDDHEATHTSGLRLWIGNGEKYCRVFAPAKYEFARYDERMAVWKAVEKMRRGKVVKLLEAQP